MKNILCLLFVVLLLGCSTTDKVELLSSVVMYESGNRVLVVKSDQESIDNFPDTVTLKTMDILLAESIAVDTELNLLDNRDQKSYEAIISDQILLNEIGTKCDYLTSVKVLDYYTPSFNLSMLTASSKIKEFITEIELKVYDLKTGEERVAVIKSSVKQRANAVVFSSDMDKTKGKEAAVAVAIERGIQQLVAETFSKR